MKFLRENYTKIWLGYTGLVILLYVRRLPIPYLYPVLLGGYVILTIAWLHSMGWLSMGGSHFLCDTCRYNYGEACGRPDRPNAVRCPDYTRG